MADTTLYIPEDVERLCSSMYTILLRRFLVFSLGIFLCCLGHRFLRGFCRSGMDSAVQELIHPCIWHVRRVQRMLTSFVKSRALRHILLKLHVQEVVKTVAMFTKNSKEQQARRRLPEPPLTDTQAARPAVHSLRALAFPSGTCHPVAWMLQ